MPLLKHAKQTHTSQKNKDVVIGASAANIKRKRDDVRRPWHTPPRAAEIHKHLKHTWIAQKQPNAMRTQDQNTE